MIKNEDGLQSHLPGKNGSLAYTIHANTNLRGTDFL